MNLCLVSAFQLFFVMFQPPPHPLSPPNHQTDAQPSESVFPQTSIPFTIPITTTFPSTSLFLSYMHNLWKFIYILFFGILCVSAQSTPHPRYGFVCICVALVQRGHWALRVRKQILFVLFCLWFWFCAALSLANISYISQHRATAEKFCVIRPWMDQPPPPLCRTSRVMIF